MEDKQMDEQARELAAMERFWARVDKNGPIPTHRPELGPCWLWLGALTKRGYGGRISIAGRKVGVHKLAWEFVHGPMPEGLVPDHLCRNRACVRETHIEAVTNVENVLRGESPQATNRRKTHCIRGHEFSKENTAIFSSKKKKRRMRICIACRRAQELRYYYAKPPDQRHPESKKMRQAAGESNAK